HPTLQPRARASSFHTEGGADTAGAGQPEPHIFRVTAQRLGVDPYSCWHVGDQPQSDGLGAVSSGMHPVLIDRSRRTEFSGVTTLGSLDELLALVGLPSTTPARSL